MLFGRRKHAAPAPAAAVLAEAVSATAAPAPSAPQLTDELIFAAVQKSLNDVFGDAGDWTVARRSPDQDDTIFHDVLVHSLATSVTAAVAAARETLVPLGGPLGLLRTPRAEPQPVEAPADESTDEAVDEPAALSWEPAPITRWADLKRPVTGEVAIIDGRAHEQQRVDPRKAA